jgi:RNA polymerase sigma factor (TIGR02999 family)
METSLQLSNREPWAKDDSGLPVVQDSVRETPLVAPTISSLIVSAEGGDRSAADALFSALYSELHGLAKSQLARGPGATLGTTTLLHEAYLNISRREGAVFPDRGRFMGYAAKVMRGLIIDYARSRQAQKRGGGFEITTLADDAAASTADAGTLAQVADALDELAAVDPALAEVVDLKFFAGFSFAEIAAMRGVSERTVQRGWEKARIYLHRAIREASPA